MLKFHSILTIMEIELTPQKDMKLQILATVRSNRVLNPFKFDMVKSGSKFQSSATEINAHKLIGTSACFVH